MDVEAYRRLLLKFLPPGAAWDKSDNSIWSKLMGSIALELQRVDAYILNIKEETDPRTTFDLLPLWEKSYGLPDSCEGVLPTVDARRKRILAQLTHLDDCSPTSFEKLFALLGFVVTITGYRAMTCDSTCNDYLYDDNWLHFLKINSENYAALYATCTSACDEALRLFQNAALECFANKNLPAHMGLIFSYGAT